MQTIPLAERRWDLAFIVFFVSGFAALLYQVIAQTLVRKGDFSKSIEPIERAISSVVAISSAGSGFLSIFDFEPVSAKNAR